MNKNIIPKKWILIRGLTRSHFHWFEFKNLIKNELNLDSVECPELPGNGFLHQLNSPTDLLTCVNELKKQIAPINEPVGILAISLGGMIATKWALEYPSEISHLVIINSSFSLSPFYDRLMPKNYLKILKILFLSNPKKIEEFILSSTSNTKKWINILQDCIRFQSQHPISLKNFIRQIKLAKHSQFESKPQCQVTVLTSENDHLVNYKCSLTIAKHWQINPHIHPTAGHDLPLDDGLWIIEQIKN